MSSDTSQLSIGEKIEIKRIGTKQDIKYSSQVLDIIDERTYSISGPIHKGTIVPISLNSTIEITYFKEERGRFLFKATVLSREEKGVYRLIIRRIDKIIRFQQRDYYRLTINKNVTITHSFMDGDIERVVEENCVTKDISGGGIRFLCDFKYKLKDVLSFELKINDSEIVSIGEVVRVKKSDSSDYNYEIGMRFIELSNVDRDILIRFIFEQQRKLRRKGLI
ncbi:flagellar brake protein [Brassicibacter mesophilus]|uniref:flagellar brake protein n=1 Tax=Brassicibacter mesophilus TaxID=745119 RepID=UPI003D19AFA6